ncbi:hypothetical protein C8R45DRAFT_1186329, partial [Mycena sanguinolenta]
KSNSNPAGSLRGRGYTTPGTKGARVHSHPSNKFVPNAGENIYLQIKLPTSLGRVIRIRQAKTKRMAALDWVQLEAAAVSIRRHSHKRGEAENRLTGKELARMEFENQSGIRRRRGSYYNTAGRTTTHIRRFPVRIRAVGRRVPYSARGKDPGGCATCAHEEVAVDISSWKKFVVVQLCRKTGRGRGVGGCLGSNKLQIPNSGQATKDSTINVRIKFQSPLIVRGEQDPTSATSRTTVVLDEVLISGETFTHKHATCELRSRSTWREIQLRTRDRRTSTAISQWEKRKSYSDFDTRIWNAQRSGQSRQDGMMFDIAARHAFWSGTRVQRAGGKREVRHEPTKQATKREWSRVERTREGRREGKCGRRITREENKEPRGKCRKRAASDRLRTGGGSPRHHRLYADEWRAIGWTRRNDDERAARARCQEDEEDAGERKEMGRKAMMAQREAGGAERREGCGEGGAGRGDVVTRFGRIVAKSLVTTHRELGFKKEPGHANEGGGQVARVKAPRWWREREPHPRHRLELQCKIGCR